MRTVDIGSITVGGKNPIVLIAGPCVIEGFERTKAIALAVRDITNRLGMPYIFKASFDKANRSSYHSFRGPGLQEGLEILRAIREEAAVPVLSDIHCVTQVAPAAAVLDVLQIPAFLCRQTDLVFSAASSGLPVNVKKGQFLAPRDMQNVVDKIREAGNEKILLTERGVSFGYNNLVVDMRSLPILRAMGYPVVFDGTHSVQLPGGAGTSSSGQKEFVPYLTRAAAAAGIDALFLEVHDNPAEALSDGANMLSIDQLEDVLRDVLDIDTVVRRHK